MSTETEHLTETARHLNKGRDHILGLQYDGPLGKQWFGAKMTGCTAEMAEAFRPEIVELMDKALEYRRANGAWPELAKDKERGFKET